VSLFPLAGRRVLVTRATHQAGKLSEGLRALGAEPVEVPVLEIRPPESYDALDRALHELARYDWLVLTSANTVRAIADRAVQLGLRFVAPRHLKVAKVGEATANAAREVGFNVTFVPESYVAESLAVGFAGRAEGLRVLLVRASVARGVIPDSLRKTGASVDVVEAYSNGMPESAPRLLREALALSLDAATFTSSSSVTHLAEAAKAASILWPFDGVKAASIGPITSQTLRDSGWEPAIEATVSDIPGLLESVTRLFAGRKS
jgi:uroporphyrinogen-III synthase